jgi:hypothetical protein
MEERLKRKLERKKQKILAAKSLLAEDGNDDQILKKLKVKNTKQEVEENEEENELSDDETEQLADHELDEATSKIYEAEELNDEKLQENQLNLLKIEGEAEGDPFTSRFQDSSMDPSTKDFKGKGIII